ncbi:MIP family Ig-specific serine endopeptidase [Mycoplasma leonicaptivi]|uniref:MIP family Ig-specific serine endopeptidase n=1 Tax=Mycoplasma leonicaptivi TaxID=36742 RepID=UPI0006887755|nr:DUF31 family protein [Mycoplasma leonicaptivi]
MKKYFKSFLLINTSIISSIAIISCGSPNTGSTTKNDEKKSDLEVQNISLIKEENLNKISIDLNNEISSENNFEIIFSQNIIKTEKVFKKDNKRKIEFILKDLPQDLKNISIDKIKKDGLIISIKPGVTKSFNLIDENKIVITNAKLETLDKSKNIFNVITNYKAYKDISNLNFSLKLNDNLVFKPSKINTESPYELVFQISGLEDDKQYTLTGIYENEVKLEILQGGDISFTTYDNSIDNMQPFNPQQPPFLGDPNALLNHIKKLNEEGIQKHKYNIDTSKFKEVDRKTIYKELYDRTLAVKIGTDLKPDSKQDSNNNQNSSFFASSAGTAWLLDYHKYTENKYKLFFATNLHVISSLSNTLNIEDLDYKDPRGFKAIGISFGKASGVNEEFPQKQNGHTTGKNVKWVANVDKFSQVNFSDQGASATAIVSNEAISAPKLVFAGFDFIKREDIQYTQEELKRKAQELYEQEKSKEHADDDKDSTYWVLKNALENNTNQFIPLYTDFAVFEVDVDFDKFTDANKTEYVQWFKDAISGLDRYLKRLKETSVLPNQDKSESEYMQTVDYISAYNNKDNNGNNLQSSKYTYTLGYPGTGTSGMSVLDYNNPIERYEQEKTSYDRSPNNKESFNHPIGAANQKMTFNNLTPYTSVFGRLLGDHYGYVFENRFSSLTYGSSGSLVYNEFGQMIGIHNLVDSSTELGQLLKRAYFAPFLLSNDFVSNNQTIKAYNLIDGSNKTKYPSQTHSFRENLNLIYKNGFSDNQYTTALFPNGFKVNK